MLFSRRRWRTGLAQQQCNQIGRFVVLWSTIESLWQQLICPNLSHSWASFVKVSKSFIFLVNSLLGNFYRHLAIFFWSHWLLANHTFKPSGYGRRLAFWRPWVRIPALYTGLTFFTCICCNYCNVCLKRQK